MEEKEEKKTGILGIGNLLLGDEGFGIHTVHYLEEKYIFPEQVKITDCGTAGIYMAPFLEECDPIYVLDVVDMKDEPGSIHHFTVDEVRSGSIPSKMSPHQLGLIEMLDICKFRGVIPEKVEFFCVVPEQLETSIELSGIVASRVKEVAEQLVRRLRETGLEIERRKQV